MVTSDLSFNYVDIFATKGVEYLVVIGFFAVFIWFIRKVLGPAFKKIKMRWIER